MVGALLTLNANPKSASGAPESRIGRVAAVGARAIVGADTANSAGGFTDVAYGGFAAAFDTLVYPLDTRTFGAPANACTAYSS